MIEQKKFTKELHAVIATAGQHEDQSWRLLCVFLYRKLAEEYAKDATQAREIQSKAINKWWKKHADDESIDWPEMQPTGFDDHPNRYTAYHVEAVPLRLLP